MRDSIRTCLTGTSSSLSSIFAMEIESALSRNSNVLVRSSTATEPRADNMPPFDD